MSLNIRLFREEIVRQSDRTVRPQIEKMVKLDFKVKKEEFLDYFDASPVTQEIAEGPDAFSRIPSVAASEGNLFSFLGFFAEQKPIIALRKYLKDNVKLGQTRRGTLSGDRMTFSTPVELPTADEVDMAMATDPQSSLEWTNRSFTSLLANGIPGLPKYLFDLTRANKGSFAASRSGPAIQTKNNLRSGSTGPINYVGDVLGYLKRLISTKK